MISLKQPLDSPSKTAAFTVIEIAIVAAIIGILAALAIPVFKHVKDSASISKLENDLRIFAQDFKLYHLDFSTYPPTQNTAGLFPVGMEDRMSYTWREPSVIGGSYIWVYSGNGDPDSQYAYIEISGNSSDTLRIDADRLSEIDDDLDDGNPSTGKVQLNGLSIRYYLVQ